jgi:hypothetical protein
MFHFSLQNLIKVFFRFSKHFDKVTAKKRVCVRTQRVLLLSDFNRRLRVLINVVKHYQISRKSFRSLLFAMRTDGPNFFMRTR